MIASYSTKSLLEFSQDGLKCAAETTNPESNLDSFLTEVSYLSQGPKLIECLLSETVLVVTEGKKGFGV